MGEAYYYIGKIGQLNMFISNKKNNKINIKIITFYKMKAVSQKLLSELQTCIGQQTLQKLKNRFKIQSHNSTELPSSLSKNDKMHSTTPSTASTFLRKTSAISRGRRPKLMDRSEKKMDKEIQKIGNQSERFQINNEGRRQVNRKVLTDRAVFYGNCELPYLHSSDALNCLYSKQQKTQVQALVNPSPNINPRKLVNLKFLYLYYTGIQSLRELGTGWSNLKSLTILRSPQLRDLGGANIFPNLQFLFVAHNNIRQISDIMYHSSLRCVDLEDNLIDLMEQVQYIYTIPLVEWVNIKGNPVTSKKQNYRIIAENLGFKLQLQPNTRLQDYISSQYILDGQLLSHQSIQVSHNLFRNVNNQLRQDEIQIQRVWRRQGKQNQQINEIDFVTYKMNQRNENEEQSESEEQAEEQFIITPLEHFHKGKVQLDFVKKYFQNKVNVQLPQEQSKQLSKKSIINPNRLVQKLAATQNLQLTNTVSEEKCRLVSGSLKKRRLKLSLPKQNNTNTEKYLQTQQKLEQHKFSETVGGKFLKKRSLLKRPNILGD